MGRASIIAIEIVRVLARPMPIAWVSALGGWLGRHVVAGRRRNRRADANLALAFPEMAGAERARLARAMWDNYGRTLAETLVLDRIAADEDRVRLLNPEVLEGDPARGVVFVGAHFGNWEVNVLAARGRYPDIAGLYKPIRDPRFDAWVREKRAPFYPGGVIPADAGALLKTSRQVKGGGAICLLADHRDAAGIEVEFFGRPAPSSAFPALLAHRYGARVILAFTHRRAGARFDVNLHEVEVPDGPRETVLEAVTRAIQAEFERRIRAEPALWLWFYKRWADNPLQPGS